MVGAKTTAGPAAVHDNAVVVVQTTAVDYKIIAISETAVGTAAVNEQVVGHAEPTVKAFSVGDMVVTVADTDVARPIRKSSLVAGHWTMKCPTFNFNLLFLLLASVLCSALFYREIS